tara:strand:- start:1001 stop:1129 length:129 start_codon:yes stop_codon:yes gene_type:complete
MNMGTFPGNIEYQSRKPERVIELKKKAAFIKLRIQRRRTQSF